MGFEDVLNFWFGELEAGKMPDRQWQARWFIKSEAFDQEIKEKFLDLIERAENGEIDHWMNEKRSALAWLIVTDQFRRNVYRDSAKVFSEDKKAQALAQKIVDKGWHEKMHPIEACFAYLPFEHAEDIELQNKCVELHFKLWKDNEDMDDGSLKDHHIYAVKHQEIIKKFGRFPHRNKALGRESTPAEIDYLSKPGAGF